MKIIVCLSIWLVGAAAAPSEQEVPNVPASYLDKLLEEKRYEEFSYLMRIDDPSLVHSEDDAEKSPEEAMFNGALERGDILPQIPEAEEDRQVINFDKYRRNRWPNGVPYKLSNDFNQDQKNRIERGIREWNALLFRCIRLRRATNSDKDYVYIFSGNGCYSYVGKIGGQQALSLNKNGCIHNSVILHELNHAIGFTHEQNREDRDKSIRMRWENIPPRWRGQYRKTYWDTFRLVNNYDYYSIMHYPHFAPGTNKPAFDILKPGIDSRRIGRGRTFTRADLDKIKRIYPCRK